MEFLNKALIHHSVKQGSPEWLALRRGRFTGSQIHRIICDKKTWRGDLLTKGGQTYTREVLCLQDKENFESDAMIRGGQLEPQAVFRFELMTGFKVQTTGFFTFEGWLGVSTDGIVQESKTRHGILEVKSPESEEKHLHYCTCRNWADLKKVSPLLYWQMNLALLLTDLNRAWFISYFPDYIGTTRKHLALFSLCLERDNKILEKLSDCLFRAKVYREQLIKKLNL